MESNTTDNIPGGVFKFFSDYKFFILFALSLIICFVIVVMIYYKRENEEQNKNEIEESKKQLEDSEINAKLQGYEQQNRELIAENNKLARQLQYFQHKVENAPPKKNTQDAQNTRDAHSIQNVQDIRQRAADIKQQFMDCETETEEEEDVRVDDDDKESDSEVDVNVDDILDSIPKN